MLYERVIWMGLGQCFLFCMWEVQIIDGQDDSRQTVGKRGESRSECRDLPLVSAGDLCLGMRMKRDARCRQFAAATKRQMLQ